MDSIAAFIETPAFLKFLGLIGTVSLIGLFWWRAGSISSLLEHLWRLIAGRAEVNDVALKQFIQDIRDIEKFRFVYGLKVRTISDIRRLLNWIKKHDLGVEEVQQVRMWIDVRATSILCPPPKRSLVYGGAFVVFAYISSVAFFVGAVSESTLLEMKASRVWFLSDAKTVRPVFFEDWKVDAQACRSDRTIVSKLTSFSKTETDLICDALVEQKENEKLKAIVSANVTVQRWLGGILLAISLYWLIKTTFTLRAAVVARKLWKRIADESEAKSESVESKPADLNSIGPRSTSRQKASTKLAPGRET